MTPAEQANIDRRQNASRLHAPDAAERREIDALNVCHQESHVRIPLADWRFPEEGRVFLESIAADDSVALRRRRITSLPPHETGKATFSGRKVGGGMARHGGKPQDERHLLALHASARLAGFDAADVEDKRLPNLGPLTRADRLQRQEAR